MFETYVIPGLIIVLQTLALLGALLVFTALILYADRKVWAAINLRKGPNVVGPFGLLQSFADGLKVFLQETIIPSASNKGIFIIAPIITFTVALAAGAVVFAGFLPLYAVAVDWGRWMSMFMFSAAFLTMLLAIHTEAGWLRRLADGIDDRPVTPHRTVKSSGAENTYPEDLTDLDTIGDELDRMARLGVIANVQPQFVTTDARWAAGKLGPQGSLAPAGYAEGQLGLAPSGTAG